MAKCVSVVANGHMMCSRSAPKRKDAENLRSLSAVPKWQGFGVTQTQQNTKHKTQNTKHKTQNTKHKTQKHKTQNTNTHRNPHGKNMLGFCLRQNQNTHTSQVGIWVLFRFKNPLSELKVQLFGKRPQHLRETSQLVLGASRQKDHAH